jgi:hypothetical protein
MRGLRHYRLPSPRAICAHKSSKCATDFAGSSAAVGPCGWLRTSMSSATFLPSIFACSCKFSSACFRGTSRRKLVPIMKVNAAATSAAATKRWPSQKYTPPRGAAPQEERPWSRRSWSHIEKLASATGQAENEIICGEVCPMFRWFSSLFTASLLATGIAHAQRTNLWRHQHAIDGRSAATGQRKLECWRFRRRIGR